MTIIDARSLVVTAGGKRILDDVSLSLRSSETLAVVGPNGAGKSTLLRVLAGELRPDVGTVTICGRDLRSFSPELLAKHRAVLSQSVTVTFPFTVRDIVAMGAARKMRSVVDAAVDAALAEVGLSMLSERVFMTLSGGEQQRAHFARILVQMRTAKRGLEEQLLLLDEPTASLDLRHQLQLMAIARGCAAQGAAVLAIIHDLNLAAIFAERILVLDRGAVVGDGSPATIVTEALVSQVFGVRDSVGRTPDAGRPFVLPHAAQPS